MLPLPLTEAKSPSSQEEGELREVGEQLEATQPTWWEEADSTARAVDAAPSWPGGSSVL